MDVDGGYRKGVVSIVEVMVGVMVMVIVIVMVDNNTLLCRVTRMITT